MTREQCLAELDKSFKDYKFFDLDHHYEYKGQRVGVSVTTYYAQYENKFNAQEISEKVATKENKNVTEVLQEWKYKNEFACEKGSTCHEYAQSLWTHENWNLIKFDESEEYINAVEKIKKQADNFYNDFKDKLEHVACEYVIGDDEYDIASAVDHLFINRLTGGLVLVDYKTNADMYKNDKYAKYMMIPISDIKDTTINHYSIQTSIYKYIIEKKTKLKVDEVFIVWFSELNDNYNIVETYDLENQAKLILENRRVKNMKSIPVLLIGQSGSGKSTSLRNFKREEVAVINVLGKPLPFKSDINAKQCDDYGVILEAIAKTPKKTIVIDDANYLITNEFMSKVSVKGYDKYSEMGSNFFKLINGIKAVEGGKTVYLIMHEDTDENNNVKPKTIGKMLDEKVNIQGMFTVCIRSMFDNGNYIFRLKTNGQDCVKTPFGMFENDSMDNDLKEFDKVVREYYELDKVEDKKEE